MSILSFVDVSMMSQSQDQHSDEVLPERTISELFDSLSHTNKEPVPISRLPYFDIFTHDSDEKLQGDADSVCMYPLRWDGESLCNLGWLDQWQARLCHLRRYARFIINLIDQDSISIFCNIETALDNWDGIIIAERPLDSGDNYQLQVFDPSRGSSTTILGFTDFSYHFSSIKEWKGLESDHSFSVMATPTECHVRILRNRVPEAAIMGFVGQLQDDIIRIDCFPDSSSTGNTSVLNWHTMDHQVESCDAASKKFLHDIFEAQAAQTPDRGAIEYLHLENPRDSPDRLETWSYKELNAKCDSLASNLQATLKSDLPQGSLHRIVPVFLSTSPDLYISYLAILKAGYAFCPLPTDVPAQRLSDILAEIQPSVVIGAGPAPENGLWAEASAAFNIHWLDLRDCPESQHVSFASHTALDDLAYLMYTSGSTGKPKGVQITHHAATTSVVAHMKQYRETIPRDVPMRWCQFAAPTFDPSIMEIFTTLCSGGTLCSAPREMMLSTPEAVITETRSTIMMSTPGFASMLDIERIPTLKYLWTMGEILNSKVVRRFAHPKDCPSDAVTDIGTFSPALHLCNAYGPTEAAINVTFFPDVPTNMRGSIIGYPLDKNIIMVVDSRSADIKPVPLGFVGELVIGGKQVSIGYLQRPDESSATFVTDERYGRLYRTGDRARIVWDTKGMPILEYLGRLLDDQIKVNGQRVELGEIENTLCTVPEVRSAVAAPDPNEKHQGSLLACLLLEPTTKLSFKTIEKMCRQTIASQLPLHMQPTKILRIIDIPRTAAGKVDRKEIVLIASTQRGSGLRPSEMRDKESSRSLKKATRSLNEKATQLLPLLNKALQKTMGPSYSAADELKYWLDSLSALRFLRNIKQQGVETLSLKDILHARSVRDLALVASDRSQTQRLSEHVRRSGISTSVRGQLDGFNTRWQATVSQNLGVAAEDVLDILPTTATQERILLSFSKSRHEPFRPPNYVHHSIHRFARGTEVESLKTAWCNVLGRHDVYRTLFMPVDDDLSSFAQVTLSPSCCRAQLRWVEKDSLTELFNSENADVIDAASEAEGMIALESPIPVLTLLKTSKTLSVMLSLFHALFDLSSLHLLLEELGAEIEGKIPPLRTELRLAVQSYFASQDEETDSFWTKHMNGYESLTFPALTGVRPELTFGSTKSSQITSALTVEQLEKRSRNLMCSPLSALQAAWATILLAYTSTVPREVAFGTLIAGRSESGSEVCMAPTFNIVPTRVRSERFSLNIDMLRALTNDNSKAADHMHQFPRSKAPDRPPYDTTIALQATQNMDVCSGVLQNTIVLPMAHDYAAMIEAIPDVTGRMSLKVTYSDAYFDHKSAEMMLSQLDKIIIWVLANPMLPYRESLGCLETSKLSILNPISHPRTTADSNLIHAPFEHQAQKHADHTALEYYYSLHNTPESVRRWSYGELNAEADEIATDIRLKIGDVTGTIIPILMEKQAELYLAILGVLKAGAAWSPMDTSSPIKRRLDLIARLDAKLILVSESTELDKAEFPEDVGVMAVSVKPGVASSRLLKEPNCHRRPTSTSLAYLIWTSGTTGAPKGVQISHDAASTSMKAIQTAVPCRTKNDNAPRCLQFSQHTFDVFVQDLFYTWGVGGTIISATRETMTHSFADLSRISQASHAFLTPAFATSVQRESCPTLEIVTMIGEKLPQQVADNWGLNIKAYNTYGPAEATVVSTLTEFSGSGRSVRSSNIGRPLPSVSCCVLRDGKEVMVQGMGELALSGPQLANGYLDDPAMTSAKFIKRGSPEKVLYLTGDIVRQLANGTLEFIGREDDLVKLGGIRVELSEISFAMKECHKLVRQIESCYMGRSDRSKAVVSFIAADIEHEKWNCDLPICTREAVEIAKCAMSQAKLGLPRYMLPGTIVIIQKIPNTSSAKVDRKALERAYDNLDLESWEAAMSAGRSAEVDDQKPSGSEGKIKQCLSDFCNIRVETISLHSSLNSLGIDSLNAARFVHRLMNCSISLSLTDVLQSQTVNDMVHFVNKGDQHESDQNSHALVTSNFSAAWLPHVQSCLDQKASFVMPTTPLQEGVLIESMLNQSSYWSNHIFELKPNVEIERLHSAWELICKQTQALRTRFVAVAEVANANMLPQCPSSFLQIVCDEPYIDWAELDTRRSLHEDAQERANRIFSYHQRVTFHRPPWAITTIGDESRKHMMLTIHHAIHDAKSVNFVMSDLASAYASFSVPKRHHISEALPKTINYDIKAINEQYWRNILLPYADIGSSRWPNLVGTEDSTVKAMPRSMISESYKLRWSSEEFFQASHGLGTRLSIVLKVAFGCLLQSYLETPTIVFAEIVSQRIQYPQLRDAVAPLVATMPIPFTAKQNARDTISEQNRSASKAWARGSPSGPLIRRILRRSTHEPLYPAVFVFHEQEDEVDCESDLQQALWSQDKELLGLSTEHELSLNVYPGDQCIIEVVASDRIMCHESLRIFCRQIESLVHAILENPDQPLLGLLDDAEPDVISLSESRLPEPVHPACSSNPTYWLEHYARCHPNWNAVEVATDIKAPYSETRVWSFKRLLKESRKIANFIKERGFGGKIIAVCIGRTLQSYAIIVGILMSSNTYLPIDDGLPQQRKLLLLKDSDCALLFTDGAGVKDFGSALRNCAIIDVENKSTTQEILVTTDAACAQPIPGESAYLLYTSGSTGKPKGVLVSYRSLCGFIEGLSGYMGHCSRLTQSRAGVGKWLGLASRAFDVHLGEMFLAWRSGLTAVTAPRELLLDDLWLAFTSLGVTHAICVPSLLEQADLSPDQLPDLVFMTVGGEKISKKIVDTWASHPRVTAINAYGPTELAIGCSAAHLVPNFNVNNIGLPYSDTTAHILVPETNHYVVRGQAGELCFTGCLVGNGYLNTPDAKGFVDFQGQRMYRTGDMARMLPNGSLTFLGRRDDQTKLRGQRLELSEISESIRTSYEGALEVITLLLNHPVLPGIFLICFVSDSTERSQRYNPKLNLIDERFGTFTASINEICRRNLPSYMVPDYIIPVNIVPLAPVSGKVDNKALKAFFTSLPPEKLLGINDKNSLEKKQRSLTLPEQRVVAVVKDVLCLDRQNSIQATTNLFALGLDSLNAIGLMVKLRQIGFNCNLIALLSNPCIEGIARLSGQESPPMTLQRQLTKTGSGFTTLRDTIIYQDDFHIPVDAVEKILPCLPMQENTVTATINSGGSITYVNNIVFELRQDLDINRFKEAWLHIIEYTPILRTVFYYHQESFVQVVLRSNSAPSPWMENSRNQEDSVQVLDLNCDILNTIQRRPPLRLLLEKTSNGPHIFSVAMHHALYDGHSFELMMEDLWVRYQNKSTEPVTAFEDLLELLAAQTVSSQEAFWTHYLGRDEPRKYSDIKAVKGGIAISYNYTFKSRLSGLQHLANSLEVTLATLSQCVFAVALARRTNNFDVIFGSILLGRSVPIKGAESIRAPCISTIPQRIQFQTHELLSQVLTQIQSTSIKCLEYQHTSLRDISRWTHREQPMFDALFSFSWSKAHEQSTRPWTQIESSMVLDYPFAVGFTADKTNNILAATCEFTGGFGSKRNAESFVDDMEILLTMMVNGEDPAVSSLGIIEQAFARKSDVNLWDEAEWSAEEITIREVVRDMTGMENSHITKNASFFQLGIDSVSAIRLAKCLRENNLSVRSSDVMLYPCVGSLGYHLSDHPKSALPEVAIAPTTTETSLWALAKNEMGTLVDSLESVYYATPLQAGMMTATLAANGDAYVHQHELTMTGEVNIEKLRKAWATTVQSLDILRTFFYYTSKQSPRWIACVYDKKTKDNLNCLEIIPSSLISAPLRLLQKDDFKRSPFLATLSQRGDRTIFGLTIHHALYDGISLPMIFERLSLAYRGGILEVTQVPPFYHAATCINEVAPQSMKFWLDSLEGYCNSSTHVSSGVAARQRFLRRKCSISLMTVIENCKLLDVTIQTILLTAYSKALAIILRRRDIAFGHVVAGRTLSLENCESIVGPLFNTVPFRIRLDHLLASNSEMMAHIQDLTAKAQAHQHASLAQVQDEWRKKYDRGATGLFDSLFLFQKATSITQDDFLRPSEEITQAAATEYCVNLEVEQSETELMLSASYHDECLRGRGLDSFLDTYEDILQNLLCNPAQAFGSCPPGLAALPLKSPENETKRLLHNDEDPVAKPNLARIKSVLADISKVPVENITNTVSIFALGLTSLSAIAVAAECRRRGISSSVANILQGVTAEGICDQIAMVNELEDKVQQATKHIKFSNLLNPPVTEDCIESIIPALSGQMYHLNGWLRSARRMYMPTWTYTCSKVEPDRLQLAWDLLRQHHPILRTTFAALTSTTGAQIILKPSAFHADVPCLVSQDLDLSIIQRYIREEQRRDTVLETPPVRLRLVKGSSYDVLLLSIHHALYDACSLPLMITDLSKLYKGESLEGPPKWQHFVEQSTRNVESSSAPSFWKQALHPFDDTIIRRHRSDASTTSSKLPSQNFISLPQIFTNIPALSVLSHAHKVTLPTVLLLSVARSLSTRTRTTNPIFGTYTFGRSASSSPGLTHLAGPCLNILPLVVRSPGKEPWYVEAQEIQTQLAARIPFEQDALPNVLEWASEGKGTSDVVPFNTFVNILWHEAEEQEMAQSTEGEGAEGMFKVVDVGVPSDFIPEKGFEGKETGLEALRWPKVEDGIYVDIALSRDGQSVDIGARIEGGVMWEEEVREWLKEIAQGVLEMLKQAQLD